ncbi:MAG: nucleotidyltransferase family protein [Chloroflexota bacterium]|nr:nucleotidyltransferase family protein [Chloroflexota bacterium]
MLTTQIPLPKKEIAAFCRRWMVVEFALFGSTLRDDFSPNSDIDALVDFSSRSEWSLFEHIQMKQELKTLFGRKVDLITQRALEQSRNDLLRTEILESARVIYSVPEDTHV